MFKSAIAENAGDDNISKALREDVENCRSVFNGRIKKLVDKLPSARVNGHQTDVRLLNVDQQKFYAKALLLNKYLNKPNMFDDEGEPYRDAMFYRLHTMVSGISMRGDEVKVNFSRPFWAPWSKKRKIAILIGQGFTVSKDGKSATIPKERLLALDESKIYSIQQAELDTSYCYLNKAEIELLIDTYKPNKNTAKSVNAALKTFAGLREEDKPVFLSQMTDKLDMLNR